MTPPALSTTERYDRALRYAHNQRLPTGFIIPLPTCHWPPENVALLDAFREWLIGGGTAEYTTNWIYMPMAGHVLGLFLRPHPQLDLETDLAPALRYLLAKRLSAASEKMQRNALAKFTRFLREVRGLPDPQRPPPSLARFQAGLPVWVLAQLDRLQHQLQGYWRPARLSQALRNFWGHNTRFWRWLFNTAPIAGWHELRRQHLVDFVDYFLAEGYSASTINMHLRNLSILFNVLREQDIALPRSLQRLPMVKEPTRLPRFLTDTQVLALRSDFEQQMAEAPTAVTRRDALLDRAAFFLLWHGGLRLGELEELYLEDLDLAGGKLAIRQGKGQKDRTVYLTKSAISALAAFLEQRGKSALPQVFLYRNRPLNKDLVRARLKAAGERCDVPVSPHRLRHTCATQLLNAGCKITSIQRLLGHAQIDTTLGYANVHDATLAADYHAAMEKIEGKIRSPHEEKTRAFTAERASKVVDKLAQPDLTFGERLRLARQLKAMLK
jgi:site-specific recombinase XerD